MSHPDADELLIPYMKKYVSIGKVGPHPDVYGRMAWDQPSVTLKRECAHTGNGRYAHPNLNRLCSVREMGILQGFPSTYEYVANSLANMYRHIGDAVPPLISYQIAHVCSWILSEIKPNITECVLSDTNLLASDIVKEDVPQIQFDMLESA